METTITQSGVTTYTEIKDIIRELRRPGKVHVYTVLMTEFPIEKQAAIDHVLSNNDCKLLVWEDGYRRLENAR